MIAVEELFRAYRDDVYRFAVSYTHSCQEAEDVCQTVFLKLMQQKHIAPGKERAWLMQVTANQCRSLLRSAWWKRTMPLEEPPAPADAQDGGILPLLLALDPKYRAVLYLHYYEQLPVKEIATLLKISPTAVTTRLSRGREMLKQELLEG